MSRLFSEYPLTQYHKDFRKQFPNTYGAGRYLCQVSLRAGICGIDVIAFDGYLHGEFGEYEEERKLSMSQLIEKEYGEAAMVWVRELL